MDFVHEWQQKLVDKLSIVEELREDRNLVHKGGLMAQTLNTIKKRSTFLNVKKKGQFLRSFSFNIQILKDMNLDNNINVGYTATKRLGNAIKRNKAKRIMRELAKKVISKYGKKNFYYVIIAKNSLLKTTFKNLENELIKIIKKYLKQLKQLLFLF